MDKLPEKLTKKNLIKCLKESQKDRGKTMWDSGYDSCLETIGQQFLTDKELRDVFRFAPEDRKDVCKICKEERFKHNSDGTCGVAPYGLYAHTGKFQFNSKENPYVIQDNHEGDNKNGRI